MKYQADIDLRNQNTSHALLVELVGTDQRVLDVGCATGDLGKVLKRRGCRVSGVELDRSAAEVAEGVLEEVLIGDVGDLDLVGHFGKESFDVVVFGDVLEHLADPVAVLRKVRPLLGDSSAVVASIPNVAHGSVRLSLLAGRFDYRPLGLLDATHLRFFTRGSLHEMLREAGLVPVDMRRTTAGVFDTEIELRRADFDQGVVDAVEGDPDSTTYQFVLRAVPEDSPDAIDSEAAPAAGPAARTRIGICADWQPDDLRTALLVRVADAELVRRLPGAAIRCFSSSLDFRPSPHDGGTPVEPLGMWSAERARQLATELDCIVVTGDADADSTPFPLERVAAETDVDCPVLRSGDRLPDALLTRQLLPDPLLLVPRLLRAEVLARRLEFVRMMGWFPKEGPALVLEVVAGLLAHAPAVAGAIDSAVSGATCSVVLVRMRPGDADGGRAADAIAAAMETPTYRVPDDALVDDVVAVIANAAVLAASSPSAMALGVAYGRPVAHVDLSGAPAPKSDLFSYSGVAVVGQPGELADLLDGERFRAVAGVVPAMQSELDCQFDRMAAIADAAAAGRPRAQSDGPMLPPSEYAAAMELAHQRMQQRLDAERAAVAEHLGGLRTEVDAALGQVDHLRQERARLEALARDAAADTARHGEREVELRDELDRVVAELEALKGIRVLRVLRPARAIYARLRGSRL